MNNKPQSTSSPITPTVRLLFKYILDICWFKSKKLQAKVAEILKLISEVQKQLAK